MEVGCLMGTLEVLGRGFHELRLQFQGKQEAVGEMVGERKGEGGSGKFDSISINGNILLGLYCSLIHIISCKVQRVIINFLIKVI